ncbi:glycosyltransferase family 4 protein [Thermodesulfobium acidiphilum]|uniref:glycosyltransferase family 4 protein n=1 Tax=Thermodesulfobium acidiphilum TaxID=1794699 RepID=UPI001900C159|nr:MraY family glycosyltransferase [Thermodesulfobium acidiphilum]
MLFLICLFSFFLSLLNTKFVIFLSEKLEIYDKPDKRKIHSKLTSRLGGFGFFVPFLITLFLYSLLVKGFEITDFLICVFPIFFLGLYDDLFGINPIIKLAAQIFASFIAFNLGFRIDYIYFPFVGYLFFGGLSLFLTIFWLVGLSNALNLVDGMDGLASGVAILILLSMAIVSYVLDRNFVFIISIILLFSMTGFFVFNINPARIFMGDSGSLTVGFIIGLISISGFMKGLTLVTLFSIIIMLIIPVADTFWAIIRRSVSGRSIFSPDKGHFHHMLLEKGWSVRKINSLFRGITVMGSLVFFFVFLPQEYFLFTASFLIFGYLFLFLLESIVIGVRKSA